MIKRQGIIAVSYTHLTISDAYKDFTLVLSSATKTFNIAGTKNSFTIIENEDLRKAFKQKQLANNQHEIPTDVYKRQIWYLLWDWGLNHLKRALWIDHQDVFQIACSIDNC